MAQNGPQGHKFHAAASNDGHSAPPTTVAFSLKSVSPYGNGGGSSSSAGNKDAMDASAGMGKKNRIPDLNMEDRDSAGGSKDKPRSEAEAVEVASADADADKGKSVATADDGEPSVNIILERERRKRMKDLFSTLQDLMPHVPQKTDKATLVGEAIQYIKFLEEKAATLGKQKLEQALARPAAVRGEASSSSSSLTAMPQTAQGMAALYSPHVPRGWGGVPVPPAAPAVPASPLRFKTWTGRNMVLTVANDNGYISVWASRRGNTLSMVVSVLGSYGIDVITAQISSDSVRTLLMIFAHPHPFNWRYGFASGLRRLWLQVNRTNGENRPSEEVYLRAVWELMFRLHRNN